MASISQSILESCTASKIASYNKIRHLDYRMRCLIRQFNFKEMASIDSSLADIESKYQSEFLANYNIAASEGFHSAQDLRCAKSIEGYLINYNDHKDQLIALCNQWKAANPDWNAAKLAPKPIAPKPIAPLPIAPLPMQASAKKKSASKAKKPKSLAPLPLSASPASPASSIAPLPLPDSESFLARMNKLIRK